MQKNSFDSKVLLIGFDEDLDHFLTQAFTKKKGFEIFREHQLTKGIKKILMEEIPIVIISQTENGPTMHGFVKRCERLLTHPCVIVLTHQKSIQNIREFFQEGAHDCLILPLKPSHLFHSIERGLERRKAQIYGVKDPLTGLYNRYTFRDMLKAEVDRARRYDRHLSLLMIDIDHFKKINDRFGHMVGDQILVELSEILTKSFRKTDVITRFGGEEFAIILPETTVGHATMLAERIRKAIEAHHYRGLSQDKLLTVSIGVSNYHTPGDPPGPTETKLIHSADQALYAAKKEGRNKVCISVPVKERTATT